MKELKKLERSPSNFDIQNLTNENDILRSKQIDLQKKYKQDYRLWKEKKTKLLLDFYEEKVKKLEYVAYEYQNWKNRNERVKDFIKNQKQTNVPCHGISFIQNL